MDIVIVGSGPSAAAVSLALQSHREISITVLDLGAELEADRVASRDAMSAEDPAQWNPADVALLSTPPRPETPGAIPRKQIYGSNFPFADLGQLRGLSAQGTANDLVVSGAYGGFSNTWGAQVMPYSTGTFRTWPITRDDLEPHYRAILKHIPYSGECDDLEETFPLLGTPDRLPRVAERTSRTLSRYEAHRIAVRQHGVIAAHARLALRGSACRLCGLCMTGCPYELIYSASQTFDELRKIQRVNYHSGVRVHRVTSNADGSSTVHATSISGRETSEFRADRVFLCAGAVGTTRIVASSLGLANTTIELEESAQFMMPFASLRPVKRLSQDGEFTLNQFNLFVSFDSDGKDASLIHCYPYNDIMMASLPTLVNSGPLSALTKRALRHFTVGLGYLPSWASPKPQLKIGAPPAAGELIELTVTTRDNEATAPMLKEVIARLRRSGAALDLHPIPGQTKLSGTAKSYHFGGSFPHSFDATRSLRSDLLGRVDGLKNVHLVDASVFPTVPATTFTLTIMANAHRIASAVARGDGQ
jgi:choline dehydrogenase-like flavoprotein